jgi:Ni/Co efflux regulator RcnB
MLRLSALLLAGLLVVGGMGGLIADAWADPPAHAQGKGKGKKDKAEKAAANSLISEHDRGILREYFGQQARSGKCPPGLAKKNNGCLPPGQAKKWSRGQQLSRDVTYYRLPPDLLGHLVPPAGTEFVRVAGDILLIAAGTGMVLDAVEDLMRF